MVTPLTGSRDCSVIYRQETIVYRRQKKFRMISPINFFCKKDTLYKVSRSIAFVRPENLSCYSKMAINCFTKPDQVLIWVLCTCAEVVGGCCFNLKNVLLGLQKCDINNSTFSRVLKFFLLGWGTHPHNYMFER